MINVYWDAICDKNPAFKVLINEPVHALSAAPRGDHLRCPAVQDYYRNAFNIVTPFSTTFKVGSQLTTSGDDAMMHVQKHDDTWVIQIYPSYVFYAKDVEVTIQLTSPHLTLSLPVIYLNGEYNITHWLRPIQPAFVLSQDLQIQAGDAVAGVRFITPNHEPVKLIRKALSCSEKSLLDACKSVTMIRPSGNQLDDLYLKHDALKGSLDI